MADWSRKQERSKGKRNGLGAEPKKAKRKRLDPLVNPGMEVLDDGQDEIDEGLTVGGVEQEMVEKNIFPEKTVKMKQLELDFVKILGGPEQKLHDDVNGDEDLKHTIATVATASAEAKDVVVVAQKQIRRMTIKQMAKKNAR